MPIGNVRPFIFTDAPPPTAVNEPVQPLNQPPAKRPPPVNNGGRQWLEDGMTLDDMPEAPQEPPMKAPPPVQPLNQPPPKAPAQWAVRQKAPPANIEAPPGSPCEYCSSLPVMPLNWSSKSPPPLHWSASAKRPPPVLAKAAKAPPPRLHVWPTPTAMDDVD